MPQMSPMLWLVLFMMFSSMFMLFMISNYYLLQPQTNKETTTYIKSNSNNWKW